jgi:surfeit locus 1 family protein
VRRFPLGLTITALAFFAILIGLGFWQLRRLDETNLNRQRLVALIHAPSQPLKSVLARSGRGADLDHTRVSVQCEHPDSQSPVIYRYSVADGAVAWRVLTMCRLAGLLYDGIAVDRGRVAALNGAMDPRAMSFSDPEAVTGVLRSLGGATMLGDDMASGIATVHQMRVVDAHTIGEMARLSGVKSPAPFYIVAESEVPAPAGVTPAPVAEDVPRDNFQYALTWFGLAAALAWVYAAMVWRRLKVQ